ncbi:hypothetical protein PP187_gp198 [Klebsiella phage vB_KvM-Eowyn]|uniref:Uncharacterized protein n=1 Tax=Klebsiella phage vB_KvM-Eowyn TaxID=2762819 RepID=A0A7R8MJK1_9CAUD|nr:hypothetical protein PP187_gp198 [Klebsiella phage vB_KvM-Eowyn]CAD5236187.1 hypothetical protein LLCLJKAH_00198 [Klebsiella phage vB_KvM-Eowyn]
MFNSIKTFVKNNKTAIAVVGAVAVVGGVGAAVYFQKLHTGKVLEQVGDVVDGATEAAAEAVKEA